MLILEKQIHSNTSNDRVQIEYLQATVLEQVPSRDHMYRQTSIITIALSHQIPRSEILPARQFYKTLDYTQPRWPAETLYPPEL